MIICIGFNHSNIIFIRWIFLFNSFGFLKDQDDFSKITKSKSKGIENYQPDFSKITMKEEEVAKKALQAAHLKNI